MPDKNAQTIWAEVVERVKDRTISPSLWRALERATGVTVEDRWLVVGFSSADIPLRGHLASGEHRNTIDKAINEVAREPLMLRLIEGTTLADWENAKRREAVTLATREAAQRKKLEEVSAGRSWEVVLEQVSRRYAKIPMRQLPQVRARYLGEAVVIMSEFVDNMFPEGVEMDELAERSLARVIEKIATLVELPAAEVAIHYMRYRGEIK
jgi:hypothetical protein